MQEKILYNVLRQVKRKESLTSAPDNDYIKSLICIGMISGGWDYTLTDFGESIYQILENKLVKW
jgi:hypothetical protein